jgi:hypothetical protein
MDGVLDLVPEVDAAGIPGVLDDHQDVEIALVLAGDVAFGVNVLYHLPRA